MDGDHGDAQAAANAAIRAIRIDAASHPAVLRSLYGRDLPDFVLLKHGGESIMVELRSMALPTH